MSIFVFISVIVAALLHAAWNVLVKNGEDKQAGMLLLTLGHAFFGLCLIPFFSIPTGQVWLWLLASGVIHTFYQFIFRSIHLYFQFLCRPQNPYGTMV